MADEKMYKYEKKEKKQEKQEMQEMSLAEAKAYRASLHKPEVKKMTMEEKREQFRLFWAQEKQKYGKSKDLEEILWLHLKATKQDDPDKFEDGLAHFGIKKIR